MTWCEFGEHDVPTIVVRGQKMLSVRACPEHFEACGEAMRKEQSRDRSR